MKSQKLLTILFLLATLSLIAQHEEKDEIQHNSESHFRISMAIAHTYLPQETTDGTKNLILPSFALDIEYWINHRWGIGLHNDLELLNFEIKEDHEQIFIEREFPILITVDALWKPYKDLVLFFGPGIELETNKNFFVFRTGCEYEIQFASNWDLSPLIFYDMRDGAYNTLTVGIGVGYRFNGKNNHN